MKERSYLNTGLAIIAGVLVANAVLGRPTGRISDFERGEMLGRSIVILGGWIAGITCIIIHFVKKSRAKKNSDASESEQP